jgi:hypothetical protein
MDQQLRKLISKSCPTVEKLFFGRRFLLPEYRRSDYLNLDIINQWECDRLLSFALGNFDERDLRNFLSLPALLSGLAYDRPVLFLEAELGGPLLRTRTPTTPQTADLHWRWPSFKIVLPRGLIESGHEWFTHYNICRTQEIIRCPEQVAQELDLLAARLSQSANLHRLERLECRCQQSGFILSTALDEAPDYRPMLRAYQRPGDITQAQAAKYHPSVPELEARLKGGVLHMQGGRSGATGGRIWLDGFSGRTTTSASGRV